MNTQLYFESKPCRCTIRIMSDCRQFPNVIRSPLTRLCASSGRVLILYLYLYAIRYRMRSVN